MRSVSPVRPCRDDERSQIFAIVNQAAKAYRKAIPPDRWREPYMPMTELEDEIGSGVIFWGYEVNAALVGVMGIQHRMDVDLIRHAYVHPAHQGYGVGSALIAYLRNMNTRQMLVGTWAAAEWAIRFYQRHGFEIVSPETKDRLLRTYWAIPERQVETSVVLANPPLLQS